MYRCGNWTIKKAERQRIDAFKLWCWRRLLRVPWTARRSNQSIPDRNQSWIFIGRTVAEAETPYFGYLMQSIDSLESPWCCERLKAGEGDNRGWDGWMASLNQWAWVWASSGSWWWTGRPGVLQSMGVLESKQLSEWTELNLCLKLEIPWSLGIWQVSSERITPLLNEETNWRLAFLSWEL